MTHQATDRARTTLTPCWALLALVCMLVPVANMPLSNVHAAISMLSLTPSQPSGVAVAGMPITWTASSTDPTPLAFQFSVQYLQDAPRVVRDFSPKASFVWAAEEEGAYTVTVAVKEIMSATVPFGVGYGQGAITTATVQSYIVTTPVTTTALVTPTANPLVAQYRAPACAIGDGIVAEFRRMGTTAWTMTAAQRCVPHLTRPFEVAGMLPNTTYQMTDLVYVWATHATVSVAPIQTFQTGTLPSSLLIPRFTQQLAPTAQSDISATILDFMNDNQGYPDVAAAQATNLSGQVVWYARVADLYPVWSLRIVSGTTYLVGNDGTQPQTSGLKVLRAIDLAGNALQETNIGAVNDELMARYGSSIHLINGFNHDALPLPNGDLAVLAFTTATITTTPILADDLLVLDPNMQVVWAWDALGPHGLNPDRGPTLGDTCGIQSTVSLCPGPTGPLPADTIDWLHTNALTWSTLDTNIVVSIRSQDWAIKLDYNNGAGDGHIIWRMGLGGNITLAPANPSDPYPWFSHQHDVNYLDPTTLAVFDNGNTRCHGAARGTCESRGQEYLLNEQTLVATQTLNIDLGNYSPALGTAQRLGNGNFNFDLGLLGVEPPNYAQALEVPRNGAPVYVGQVQESVYRIWRLTTMYAPTNPPCPLCTPGF